MPHVLSHRPGFARGSATRARTPAAPVAQPRQPGRRGPWTPESLAAFESARDAVGEWIALCMDELQDGSPDEARRAHLEAEVERLSALRRDLRFEERWTLAMIEGEARRAIRALLQAA